jgi:hypothetical protein
MAHDEGIPLSEANYGPVQLGATKGRMIAVDNPPGAAFLYIDEAGLLCVIPWDDAIARSGVVKTDG